MKEKTVNSGAEATVEQKASMWDQLLGPERLKKAVEAHKGDKPCP